MEKKTILREKYGYFEFLPKIDSLNLFDANLTQVQVNSRSGNTVETFLGSSETFHTLQTLLKPGKHDFVGKSVAQLPLPSTTQATSQPVHCRKESSTWRPKSTQRSTQILREKIGPIWENNKVKWMKKGVQFLSCCQMVFCRAMQLEAVFLFS